ncbi:MAG: glycosyltransferase family 2 protein [Bacteroidales bacterium]|nr:glycosyltransferase family 2 protein [Bacteroidales bacterium]
MKRIAVIMTMHNRKETTLRCLQLMCEQQYDKSAFSTEIFLTNDGCTDGSRDAISAAYPDVHIIDGDGTLFWNRGMRKAWEEAAKYDYDYYLWLNDDVELRYDALQRMFDESTSQSDEAIIVGSTCSKDDCNKITYGGWRKKEHPVQDVSKPQLCETMNGNVVLIPKYVFQCVGFNDSVFSHAVGDVDYGFRARSNGILIITVRGVIGVCEKKDQVWKNPKNSLFSRIADYWKVTGANPSDVFRFNCRHYGCLKAVFFFITSLIHVFFPRLWKK